MKTYKIKRSYILGNSAVLIFPLVMTFVVLAEGEAARSNEWIGVGAFWLIGFVILIFLSTAKIEVGDNYVQPYFFGFRKRKVQAIDIEVLEYGNLFRGGLGVGKGLKMWVKTPGRRKYLSIGEKAYGEEAIEHMRKVLTSNAK